MSNTVIAEGKTTAEAIENGLKQLKVSKNDVDVTVLKDENKKSFFNILAPRTVRVELKLKEKHNENKNIKKVEENELSEEEFNVIKNNISNFLDKFLKQINAENIKFEIVRDENIVNLNINGENLNSLIGYRGETLNALQTLISRIGNKGLEKRHRIIVDIEGYRNKRIKALQDLAVKVAKTALKNNKSIIKNDAELKIRVEILKDRIVDLIDNL